MGFQVTSTGRPILSPDANGNTPLFTAGLSDTDIEPAAGIQGSKVIRRCTHFYQQPPGGAIVAATANGPIIRGAGGTLLEVKAQITDTIATGADRTVNVDLQRAATGGSFATLLSGTIQFTHTSTLLTLSAAGFSSTALAQGDQLRWIITVAGSASAQGIGLSAEATWDEQP